MVSSAPDRRVLGAVLAGGRSRRFGSDKAKALLDGRTLLDHALAALRTHASDVVICGREVAGVTSLTDRPQPGLGPLGGLNAALHHAAAHGFAGVLATGCDMPQFPDAAAAALIGDGPAVLEGQHLAGYWPAALAPLLDRHLAAADSRSLRGWFAVARPRVVGLAGPPLPNINTPADLAALLPSGG